MFRRSFMQAYQIRKYGKPATQYGILSSNSSVISRTERIIRRGAIYVAAIFLTIQATGDFTIFYEFFTHLKPVYNATLYQNSIPAEVRVPNEEIIENWNKLHEAKDLMKTFEVA